MPIVSSEIKYYKTLNNLGGAITADLITAGLVHDIFPKVTSDQALLGASQFACIYVKNENISLILENALLYLLTNTPLVTTEIKFGIGTASIGGVEQVIANDTTEPVGVTFTELVGSINGLILGNIPTGSHAAIWLNRLIDSDTPATTEDEATIVVDGDTGA